MHLNTQDLVQIFFLYMYYVQASRPAQERTCERPKPNCTNRSTTSLRSLSARISHLTYARAANAQSPPMDSDPGTGASSSRAPGTGATDQAPPMVRPAGLPPISIPAPAAAMLCPTLGSSSRAGAEAAAAAAPAPPVAPAGPAPVFSAVAASRPRPLRPPPLHPRAAAAQKVRLAWGARSRPRSGGAPPPPLHPRAAAPAAPKHKVRPAHSKLSRFLHLLLL